MCQLTHDDDERPKLKYPEINIQLKSSSSPEEVKTESAEKKGIFGSVFGLVKSVFEKEDPKLVHEKKNN